MSRISPRELAQQIVNMNTGWLEWLGYPNVILTFTHNVQNIYNIIETSVFRFLECLMDIILGKSILKHTVPRWTWQLLRCLSMTDVLFRKLVNLNLTLNLNHLSWAWAYGSLRMVTTVRTVLHAKVTDKTNQQASTPHSTRKTLWRANLRVTQSDKTSVFSSESRLITLPEKSSV